MYEEIGVEVLPAQPIAIQHDLHFSQLVGLRTTKALRQISWKAHQTAVRQLNYNAPGLMIVRSSSCPNCPPPLGAGTGSRDLRPDLLIPERSFRHEYPSTQT